MFFPFRVSNGANRSLHLRVSISRLLANYPFKTSSDTSVVLPDVQMTRAVCILLLCFRICPSL